MQQTIMAETIRRRKAVIVAAVVTAFKRRQAIHKQRKRKLWSREWLLRRDTGQNVLNMVFGELGYVYL